MGNCWRRRYVELWSPSFHQHQEAVILDNWKRLNTLGHPADDLGSRRWCQSMLQCQICIASSLCLRLGEHAMRVSNFSFPTLFESWCDWSRPLYRASYSYPRLNRVIAIVSSVPCFITPTGLRMFDKVSSWSLILRIKVTSTCILISMRGAFELMAAAAFHIGEIWEWFKEHIDNQFPLFTESGYSNFCQAMLRGTSQLQPAVATPVALPYHYLTSFLVHYKGSKPFMLVSLSTLFSCFQLLLSS